jgi:hypothetical protein
MVSHGLLTADEPTKANASTIDQHGTYIIPAVRFDNTTILEAWEVLATSGCAAKLQVNSNQRIY